MSSKTGGPPKGGGYFEEKGIILRSSINPRVKGIIALFNGREGELYPLLKIVVKRYDKQNYNKNTQLYKAWMSAQEMAASISLMQRAIGLMDEFKEGTLDLVDMLAEDEDARLFVASDSLMYPTIDNMFSLSDAKESEAMSKEDDRF